MGNFDENEKNEEKAEGSTSEEIQALIEGTGELSKEEKRLEKERKKEEKRLEKERKKQEKLERRMQKEGIDDLPNVSMADLKRAAKEAAEESKRAMDEVEGKASGTVTAASVDTDEKSSTDSTSGQREETPETAGATAAVNESVNETPTGETGVSEEDSEEEGREKKRKKKKSRKKERPEDVNIVKDLLSLIIYIGIVVLICFLIVTYVGRRTTVHGDSMEPTLQSGDSLWINMLAYKFGEPKRYDIIVFPYQDDVNYIKRIIGLPGETVQILDNGDILINGEVLVEPIKFDRIRNNGIASSPITLGPDEVFVLGDNRNNSRDSRWSDVGNIKLDKVVGRAAFRLTPLKKFGSID